MIQTQVFALGILAASTTASFAQDIRSRDLTDTTQDAGLPAPSTAQRRVCSQPFTVWMLCR